MSADRSFQAALRAVIDALCDIPAPSMIIGGVAVIAAGVPRQTIDIDATVLGRLADVDSTLEAFRGHNIEPRISHALEFAREHQVLLLRHTPTGIAVEVSFAWLPFEEEALARASEAQLGAVKARVARPEDLIVYKAAAWRDRDRSDIERLLVLHINDIDLSRVRDLIGQIGAALNEPHRLEQFDAIVQKARGE